MNQGVKTGVFWAVALVMLSIAAFVAWPQSSDDGIAGLAGQPLFDKFVDPLAAASMRVVTFDEEQGRLERFEVRRDAKGLWTIPSRSGYPADAVEQMRNAANSLVGLTVLDIQTTNAEDHEELGVIEPNLDNLEIGDVGVGRLVSFKDEKQGDLASLIIGDAEKDDAAKRYVRIPGQDPVYVVKLDESPLSTDFQDWIESDLLQLSSIDISEMEIKDYSASLDLGNRISLTRNYAATVVMDGSNWKLQELLEYDPDNPVAEPTPIDVAADAVLNKSKLNDMKNALDDLKLVSVVRKPDGMSASLRADQDFLNDKEAIGSLAKNGFYPVPIGASGEVEILSANGEMSVTLNDGVRYIMRFGNISGFTAEEEESEDGEEGETNSGVNRFMLVTAVVDESQFPVPDLKPVPKTLEEMDAQLNPPQSAEEESAEEESAEVQAAVETDDEAATEASEQPTEDEPPATEESPADESPADESPAEQEPTDVDADAGDGNEEGGADTDADVESADEGETESSGEGEISGSGAAQEESDEAAVVEVVEGESDAESESGDEELSEEEQQELRLELLEAEQEKITKENQRKIDERNDKIEGAERRVRELNGRFADWYYVIAESTYSKLRISRDELFEEPTEEPVLPAGGFDPTAPPGQNFQIPNLQP